MDIADRLKLANDLRDYDLEDNVRVQVSSDEEISRGDKLRVIVIFDIMGYGFDVPDCLDVVVEEEYDLHWWNTYMEQMAPDIIRLLKIKVAKKLFNF